MSGLVLHVLPLDLPRGAQRYARAMRDALQHEALQHRTLTIFDSDARVLDADVKLRIPQTWAFERGLEPRAVQALRRSLEQLRPQLVVAHGSQPLKYLALAAPHRLKIAYYKIGIVHARARRPGRRLWHSLLLRRAAKVAGVSQECLDEAHAVFGVPPDKLVLIPNGRDPNVFFPAQQREPGPARLLFVGHFSASKRPELFLDVVQQLRSAGISLRASMVGEGPLLSELQPRARALDVEMLGKRDDVAELMRSADVLLFTSRPDGEGMPGVFIEAGLAGLPTVATAVPGASTVIGEDTGGFVVPVDDTPALLARTRLLLTDEQLQRRMAFAARERCLQRFTLESSARLWARLAQELVGSGDPSAQASMTAARPA